jgi:RNA polymerase sigma-70 factor, ECF subfamily
MDGARAYLTVSEPAWEGRSIVGGERALTAEIREHEAVLRGIARRLTGNDADADDLVHDTYERALRAWNGYDERGNLRSWLAAILNNLFIDRCRRARRAPKTEGSATMDQLEVAAPEPGPPPRWTQVSSEQVTAALNTLGVEFRRVYEMHAEGKSYDEIAAELKIAKATVGTRLIRARRKLKELLEQQLGATP